MARLNDNERESILADFHTGIYSNNELAKKYKTSHTTINKIVKGLTPKNSNIVSSEIANRTELSEQSFKEVSAVETAVQLKTRHLKLINDNATKLAGKLSKMTDEVESAQDLKLLVDANDRLAITLKVADRHAPKTVIENTNALQNNTQRVIKVQYE